MNINRVKKSTVYLIGAGPGDPDLITIKGKEILEECDTVIYDQLVSAELIFSLAKSVEKHYVGKKAGRHTLTQDKINELMVKCARSGKTIARLKGGDPFLFGRGAEEAKFLKKHKINYEVIPGITAGLGASAYSGISCTDRNKSSFTIFATGHKAKSDTARVPWELLAKVKNGTIVIYMVVSKLKDIINEFIANGMSIKTPAAIIERGTSPTQRIITSNLKEIFQKSKDHNIQAPAILIIGSVVADQKQIYWIKNKSLLGSRILILNHKNQIKNLHAALRNAGAEVLTYPTLTYEDLIIVNEWKLNSNPKNKEHWLIFKNKNEFKTFIKQFIKIKRDIRLLAKFKIAAGGKQTIDTVINHHIKPDFTSKSTDPDTIIHELNKKIDFIKTDLTLITHKSETKTLLIKNKFSVKYLSVYNKKHLKWPDGLMEKIIEYPPHFIIANDPYAVEGLYKNLSAKELKILSNKASLIYLNQNTATKHKNMFIQIKANSTTKTLNKIIARFS